MRLTCPNCGAQYEVPDEVIPHEGRDVQCSNCGDTWYQAHPDHPEAATEQDAEPKAVQQDDEPEAEMQPGPDDGYAVDDGLDPAPQAPESEPPQQELDSGISDILREEARREADLRAAETSEPLESQPDLGLDNAHGDDPGQRAREARSRMAKMRGEPGTVPGADGAGSRREMLPDIEEISSTLRSSDDGGSSHTAVGPVRAEASGRKRGGFTRGFALIVIIGAIMAMVYVSADKIAGAVPQAGPVLNSYVALVDQARVWVDARLGEFVPKPDE